MCDTFVALSNSTKDGSVIFGKNSDRDGNEAHEILIVPHQYHDSGKKLHCTYVDIPQIEETNAVLLAKPFWIWGAEMGANEHGVVIGNEAIFSKVPAGKSPGLIGMDYLRLGLERGNSARQALEIITNLLEIHGQSGNCGYSHPLYYHNSFLIADFQEAWVLETVDRHWAAQKVKDVRSISNGLTIDNDFDLVSKDLIDFAIDKGWCKNREDFSFRRCYSDVIMTFGSDAKNRQCRSMELLNQNISIIDVTKAINILRDHSEKAGNDWSPDEGLLGAQICMHLGAGPVRISQTTGSMVTRIKPGETVHWLTGTSAPCTGIFKPVWLEAGLPNIGNPPTGQYDPHALWWQHEDLHREVLIDYSKRISLYKDDRDQLENEFIDYVNTLVYPTNTDHRDFSQQCFLRARVATEKWLNKVKREKIFKGQKLWHKMVWGALDKKASRK